MAKKKSITRYDDKYYDEILNRNRVIFMYDEIDKSSAKEINKKLMSMALRNKKPIIIELNSPGGLCTAGWSIIDTIRRVQSMKVKIYTIITGYACSMGSLISIVANKRMITKNAFYMMHPITTGMYDYLPFVKDRMKFSDILDNRGVNLYKEHTNVPLKLIKKCQYGEVWLTAEECLKYGVVDKIL